MASIVDRLPAFALPFVTRSLRGGRGRRFVAMSFGLALLTALTCLWIGLSDSRSARSVRGDLGMEQPIHVRESQEFVVIRTGPPGAESLEARSHRSADTARMTVHAALEQSYPPEHAELHARARALADSWGPDVRTDVRFSWQEPSSVHRLTKIVERGGVPAIVDYTPMVDLRGALQLLAMVTGGLLILMLTVVAPLLVALQQATEKHENTLQPLTGTGLGARELAVGLACGPLAIVAIFAAPIAALFVFAALGTCQLASLVLLPALLGTAIGLVFGAQLLGHLTGARRAPGLVAVGLVIMLGLVGVAGIGAASGLNSDAMGVPAVLPQAGLFALLGDCFGDPWRAASADRPYHVFRPELTDFLAPMLIGTLGAALLGLLALRALTRHIEGRATLLEGGHALLGALVCIVMINLAIPEIDRNEPFHQVIGLPLLSVPFLLLIMARVPIGDVPTKLRRIPLTRLLGEFAGWTLLHVTIGAALDGTFAGFHPMTLLGVAWSALVLVLLAVRMAATPGRILGHAWALVCLGMLPMTYGFLSAWAFEPYNSSLDGASEVPLLAMLWLAMVVWVPVSLFRHLRKHVAEFA